MEATAQQRGGELGRSGHAHQDDGDDGQHDVDALAQQHFGVRVFQLDGLLLLLLELELRHASLARLQHLLRHTHTHTEKWLEIRETLESSESQRKGSKTGSCMNFSCIRNKRKNVRLEIGSNGGTAVASV